MHKIIDNIISYLDYLTEKCYLNVSMHFDNDRLFFLSQKALAKFLKYNKHQNPYCIAVKKEDKNFSRCVQSQKAVLNKCRSTDCFCGVCYAGVSEYIHGIYENGYPVGYVCVSGYRKNTPPNEEVPLELWEKYLNDDEIPLELCNTLIPPLCIMLENLFTLHTQCSKNEYNSMLLFLNEYHTNITLNDMCKHFGRSKSYISHMFKSKNGMTFKGYCNKLKIKDAANLLLKTDLSVTEIAFNVGFNDTSYFIQLFKNSVGMSPLQYRKSNIHMF